MILLVLLELRLLPLQLEKLAIENGRRIRISGYVDKTTQSISKCKASVGGFSMEIEGKCPFSQRDRIRLIGTTKKGVIEVFLGQMELADAQIDSFERSKPVLNWWGRLLMFLAGLREKIRDIYYRLLPADEAGLVSGIVWGDKEAIGRGFYQQMIDSGTVHIVVASGYNVMLLAGFLMSCLFWLMRRRVATCYAVAAMAGYALLSGAQPAIVRASIMATVLLTGEALGRRGVTWWSLLLAGWVMMVIEPEVILSVSFQLSMAASAGLMLVYPVLVRWYEIKNSRLIEWADRLGVLTTVATMMTTAPFIWYYFGRINIIGLLSNVFVLPLVPPVMILGAATLVLRDLSAPFLYALTHLMVLSIEWFAGLV